MASPIRCERDSYRLLKKISAGGMGIVWDGQSTKDKRHVIVKEPLINGDHDQIKIERLLIEAAVLRAINDELTLLTSDHSQQLIRAHVVRYVDQLTDPDRPVLVLEYLHGSTMSEAYKGKPLDETAMLQQVLSIIKVVLAIHSKGVIHRDISPSNIILNLNRGLVLIDFGTSIVLHGATSSRSFQSGRVVFKRGFSAPELLEARSDERSDIFSVGATMLYLLTGRNPGDFMANSRSGLTRVVNDVNSNVSTATSEIVRIAMSPNPERRFQSAREMLDAVELRLAKKSRVAPNMTLGGVTYELKSEFVDIGREHTCDGSCRSSGHRKPLQIAISDSQRFVEKHHARVWVAASSQCMIEDLQSVNRTAVKRSGTGEGKFEVLHPFEKKELKDNDVIALAYSSKRGPYVTLVFHPC